MLAVAGLFIWAGYSVSLWGWCLLRGYDVTLGQLMSPAHPYGSGKNEGWPPRPLPADIIFPGGRSAAGPPGKKPAAPAGPQPQLGAAARMRGVASRL